MNCEPYILAERLLGEIEREVEYSNTYYIIYIIVEGTSLARYKIDASIGSLVNPGFKSYCIYFCCCCWLIFYMVE